MEIILAMVVSKWLVNRAWRKGEENARRRTGGK